MYDVIVIGGGHAGCEAAAAAARFGARVALLTMARADIGQMSCNPAIGGLGKGHLVREIDALDGLMGRAADLGGIQFRLLNRSRGPAVQGPRAQADRKRYASAVADLLETHAEIDVIEAEAHDLVVEVALNRRSVVGVLTSAGELRARAVVLTTGTFLGGRVHVGERSVSGGRGGARAADRLGQALDRLGLPMGRMKTGTPPRLDGRTIDWAGLDVQAGDAVPAYFSTLTSGVPALPQLCCAITRTTAATHDVVRAHLHRSAVNAGHIIGTGPRYCPSLEDKVVRFGDRESHQIFLEPEGLDSAIIYPNGISTALPAEVQVAIVNTVPGLERARITRVGYAIEYGHVDPRALGPDLQVAGIAGLYLAGQINGTTGYEEAAAQGLLAGWNAARAAGGSEPVILDRATAYLGVMIDDLTTQGVSEPYRMFTSRAEFRLRLRADNADTRLTDIGLAGGIVRTVRARSHRARQDRLAALRATLDAATATPAEIASVGGAVGQDGRRRSFYDWLRFPDVDWAMLGRLQPALAAVPAAIAETVATDARYDDYLRRQDADVLSLRRDEALLLPDDVDYHDVRGLSVEATERLMRARPASLGQAGRIPGVTPAAMIALLAHVRRRA